MKKLKKVLAFILTLCMLITGMNFSSFTTIDALAAGTLDTETFYKMVLIDCGRGYYSVDNIETIIDSMASNDYDYLMLGFGNDGLRFVLDDMSVTVDGTTYSSDTVKNAVISANDTMQNNNKNGQWTETDMNTIISYAESKEINIIPMLNCPGHAYSICKAMEACGISNSYVNTYGGYNYSVNLSNSTAMAFTEALVKKYVSWFTGKCTFFNLGCDETSNTTLAVTYVNDICDAMPDSMVPMAFCDILKSTSGYPSNLVGIDWDGGHLSSNNYHINANDNWYYVLGTSETSDGWSSYYRSINRTKTIDVTTTIGGENAYGCLLAVWNDSYLQATDYIDNIQNIIESQATASINSKYFTTSTGGDSGSTGGDSGSTGGNTDATETTTKEVTVAVGDSYTDTLTGSQTVTTNPDTSIATLSTEEKEVAGTWSASASASIGAYTSSYSTDNLIDGSTSTMYWSGDNQSVGAYVRVDLGSDQKISAIRVTPYDTSADSYCTANVQVSTDGTKWTTVGTYDGTKTTTLTFDETTARYIQVAITTAKSNWWKVAEIEWGSATTKDVTTTTEDKYTAVNVNLSNSNYSNYKTGYYYKSGDNYYAITNIQRSTSGGMRNTYTISYNNTTATVSSSWGDSVDVTLYTFTQGTSTTTTETTFNQNAKSGTGSSSTNTAVTIKGVAVGDTTAVVGNTTYNIHVVKEDVSSVDDLTINLHISTFSVWKTGDSTKTSTVSLSATDAYGVDGIAISEVVPATGSWAYAADSSVASTVFWKGVKLTYANRQAATSSKDMSMSGVNYSKIRYYGGQWSVYDMDNNVWVDIASNDEVDAYYLQKTEITSEVTTYVKDWAYTTSNCSSATGATAQKALSFAVVYPDGQLSPSTEDDIYTDSTLIYWNTTENMFIRVGVNEVYEVEKITYTAGERVNSSGTQYGSTASLWKSTDRISWNKTTTADGSTWYDETTCWTPDTSAEPVINCANFDAFSYTEGNYTTNDAILVLIYLKPVTTEDSLTVKYVDDTNSNEFLDYSVNVTNESTATEKGTFLNRLKQTSTVQAGEFTLDDSAYVKNAKGTNETFQKDLTKIPSLMGTSYASGLYEYVKAEISEDGKTLILHYNLKEITESTNYVIDFGLGINIPVTDLESYTSGATVTVGGSNYGTTSVDGNNVVYTPNKVLKGIDIFNVYIKYSNATVTETIKIYPATSVYYEEGFATYTGDWGDKISTGSNLQTTEKLNAHKNVFGYDSVYNSVGASNSSQATSSSKDDYASISFTGTGIDIYANNTTDTGRLLVQIKKNGVQVKIAFVNTVMANGTTNATKSQAADGYNIPVYSINNLEHGTYDVTIYRLTDAGSTTEIGKVNLDGFRVYNTLSDSTVFTTDKEDNPNFVELRNEVIAAYNVNTEGTTYNVYNSDYATDASIAEVAIISSDVNYDSSTVEDVLTNGPKNEIYLQPNQAITFKVTTDRQVEIGMKALNASTTYTLNDGSDVTLSSSTDMFYPISSGQTTIKNTGSSILAITDLKICDEAATLEPLTDEDIANAAAIVEGKKTADAVENVNVVDYTGKVLASTDLIANGVEGEEASFSASDIKAAAESVLPSGYAIADASSIKDAQVVYGENGSVNVLVGKVATLKITYKKLFGKTVGTATLTHVQTSSSSKYKFTTAEIKAAAPAGYSVISIAGTSVKYGSTTKITATCR